MSIKVAINGFGRIGRLALRQMDKAKGVEVVAVNDLTPADMLLHLFKYDTAQGRFHGTAELKGDNLVINGKEIKVLSNANPEELPWGQLGVDVVLECTGFFTSKEKAEKHIKAGAKKVVISAHRLQRQPQNPGRQRNRHLWRLLHHQLPRPDGESPARQIRRR